MTYDPWDPIKGFAGSERRERLASIIESKTKLNAALTELEDVLSARVTGPYSCQVDPAVLRVVVEACRSRIPGMAKL